MEHGQAPYSNEENDRLITNRNLKDYSCFTGAKTTKCFQKYRFYFQELTKLILQDLLIWLI